MDSWNTTKTRWLKSYLEITSWKKILQRKICWRMVTSPLPTRTQQLKELNLKGAHFGQWKKSSLGKIQLSNGPKLFKDKLNHVRSLEKSLNLIKIIKFRMIWISFNLFIFKIFYINRLRESNRFDQRRQKKLLLRKIAGNLKQVTSQYIIIFNF